MNTKTCGPLKEYAAIYRQENMNPYRDVLIRSWERILTGYLREHYDSENWRNFTAETAIEMEFALKVLKRLEALHNG